MRPSSTRAARPTPAERVRSILTAAHSMTVVTDGGEQEVHRLDGTGPMGHIHLHDPSEDCPTGRPPASPCASNSPTSPPPRSATASAPASPSPVSSTPLRVRRQPEHLHGVRPGTPGGRRRAHLRRARRTPGDRARPDGHLRGGHAHPPGRRPRRTRPLLLRLVRPRPDRDMVRALPVALDRYGITLRLEHPTGHQDARLPFPPPSPTSTRRAPHPRPPRRRPPLLPHQPPADLNGPPRPPRPAEMPKRGRGRRMDGSARTSSAPEPLGDPLPGHGHAMNAGSPAEGRPSPQRGALYRTGHWCARHFVVVIVLWLAAVVGLQLLDRAVGGQYSDDFDLPGVQSAQGLDVLKAHDPAAGGYGAQIVLNRPSGPSRTRRPPSTPPSPPWRSCPTSSAPRTRCRRRAPPRPPPPPEPPTPGRSPPTARPPTSPSASACSPPRSAPTT